MSKHWEVGWENEVQPSFLLLFFFFFCFYLTNFEVFGYLMNILSSVLELLKSLMILREIQSKSSPNFMIIIGSHIQTSFTVVIPFVFSSWIINEFEEFQSFSIVAILNSRYHELNSEYEQSSCKWNFGATFHFQCFKRYFHTSGVPLKGRDTFHWQKKRQPALSFLFQHFLDRCPFDKRPKKRKKKEKKARHTIATALFPRGSRRLDLWQKLFEPAVAVSVDQQMAKHEHDRMAVGNEDIDKSQVRYKGWERYELCWFCVQIDFSLLFMVLNASALKTEQAAKTL